MCSSDLFPSHDRFIVLSDWGFNGSDGQKSVAAQMGKVVAYAGAEFVLTCGDNFQYMGVDSVDSPLWQINFVTGNIGFPQAVLIRGIDNIIGSGRVGRELQIDKSFYAEDLSLSERIYILDAPVVQRFETAPRVGIDYAGDEWKNKPWRFIMSR